MMSFEQNELQGTFQNAHPLQLQHLLYSSPCPFLISEHTNLHVDKLLVNLNISNASGTKGMEKN